MRLEAQSKLGFYPVNPKTLALLASGLKAGAGASILDPCAGNGDALHHLGEALNVPVELRYGIELDEARATACQAKGGPTLWTSALGNVYAPVGSFSLVWCNPPFDDEIGGGERTELAFLRGCARWTATGGTFALLAPVHVLRDWPIVDEFNRMFEEAKLIALPADCRPYGEGLLVGRRRLKDSPGGVYGRFSEGFGHGVSFGPWALPDASPRRFEKTGPTEVELDRLLAKSPLHAVYQRESPLPEFCQARPILPLNKGHRAMLLASGCLDGLVRPAGELPHVVRGSCEKEKYVSKEETILNKDGSETHVKVESERAKLTVRVLLADGELKSWSA